MSRMNIRKKLPNFYRGMSLGTTLESLNFPFPKFRRRAEANLGQERLRMTLDALEVGDL